MNKNSKIYVAGHRGLVGSAIWKIMLEKGYTNLTGRTHKELDLLDAEAVSRFFEEEKPEYVFLAAAHVGVSSPTTPTGLILYTRTCKYRTMLLGGRAGATGG